MRRLGRSCASAWCPGRCCVSLVPPVVGEHGQEASGGCWQQASAGSRPPAPGGYYDRAFPEYLHRTRRSEVLVR